MVRVAVYSSVTLLAVAVVAYRPQLPNQTAAGVIERHAPAWRSGVDTAPAWRSRLDTLGRGEALAALFTRIGVPEASVDALLRSASPALDHRRIRAGMEVASRQLVTDSVPEEVVLRLSEERNLRLLRTDSGWTSEDVIIPWTTDTVAFQGIIESNLYEAIDRAAPSLSTGARAGLAWGIADILEYRYDMSRDLREGDVFRVLAERETSPGGSTRIGDVLALTFTSGENTVEAVRHLTDGRARYFDGEGRSLEAAFLRAPLQFRRISSRFGMRKHPILGVWRRHTGTDYSAAEGTPIRSIGDGVVTFAGRRGGYGNAIDVRHANGYVSRYGHLRAFAKGMSRGDRVAIGQTIGYVGHTGLATASHLHFEILVGGRQRDPRGALQRVEGKPLAVSQRGDFLRSRTLLLAQLERGLSRDTLLAVIKATAQ